MVLLFILWRRVEKGRHFFDEMCPMLYRSSGTYERVCIKNGIYQNQPFTNFFLARALKKLPHISVLSGQKNPRITFHALFWLNFDTEATVFFKFNSERIPFHLLFRKKFCFSHVSIVKMPCSCMYRVNLGNLSMYHTEGPSPYLASPNSCDIMQYRRKTLAFVKSL